MDEILPAHACTTPGKAWLPLQRKKGPLEGRLVSVTRMDGSCAGLRRITGAKKTRAKDDDGRALWLVDIEEVER